MTTTPATRLNLNNPRRFLLCAALTGVLLLGGAMRPQKPSLDDAPAVKESFQTPVQNMPMRPKAGSTTSPSRRPAQGPTSPKLKKSDAIARDTREAEGGGIPRNNGDPTRTEAAAATESSHLQESDPAVTETEQEWPNLVKNSSFESGISGWAPFGGSEITRIGGGFDGSFALEMRGPTKLGTFGVSDGTGWVPRTEVAGTRYRASVWVRSARHRGHAVMRVREMMKDAQVGSVSHASVALSPAWQLIALEYVNQREGSRLDIQILDDPRSPGEIFQTDNIVILRVPNPPLREMKALPQPAPQGDLT